jgi:hypothetical protein
MSFVSASTKDDTATKVTTEIITITIIIITINGKLC